MKITIDNTLKTIEIDQDVNFKELFDYIATTIKNWEEYKIKATGYIWNANPYYINPLSGPYTPEPSPFNPSWTITCSL